jgi:hypothetical protein
MCCDSPFFFSLVLERLRTSCISHLYLSLTFQFNSSCILTLHYLFSHRDHRPGGFSLELGLKDCTLVNAAAREVDVPMPFLSVLLDRYTSAKAKGRSDFDWSAIGLSVAEDAGIDVSDDVARTRKDVDEGNLY